MTLLETAASLPLFASLEEAELQRVLHCTGAAICRFAEGDCIAQTDRGILRIGVLLRGSAEITYQDVSGASHAISPLASGEMFGLSALLSAGEDSLHGTVIAQSAGEALILDATRIRDACAENCTAHRKFVTNALLACVRANNQLRVRDSYLEQKTMRRKILSYLTAQSHLAHSASFTIPLDRRQMADYLGVDRSALSAELSRMKKEGIIDCHLRQFTLKSFCSDTIKEKQA